MLGGKKRWNEELQLLSDYMLISRNSDVLRKTFITFRRFATRVTNSYKTQTLGSAHCTVAETDLLPSSAATLKLCTPGYESDASEYAGQNSRFPASMQARTLDIPIESCTKNVHEETRVARIPPQTVTYPQCFWSTCRGSCARTHDEWDALPLNSRYSDRSGWSRCNLRAAPPPPPRIV
jgi:hypothetical protein